MMEPLSMETRAVVRETLQRVVDDLQFYADEWKCEDSRRKMAQTPFASLPVS
jgi:hypothetical protein